MDRNQAIQLLASFRPGHDDPASHPWTEAFGVLDRDPVLANWFRRQQTLDEAIGFELRNVSPPVGLKQAILDNRPSRRVPFWRRPVLSLSLAAAAVASRMLPMAGGGDGGGSIRIHLHITTGSPPQFRINGSLTTFDSVALTATDTKRLCYSVLTDAQRHKFEEDWELDFSFGVKGLSRFRGNVYMQRGAVAGAFRAIFFDILNFSELGIPAVVNELIKKPKGLVLVTGPTGQESRPPWLP